MHLNVTGLAGSGPERETRAWSVSRSIGRACGSTVASAIVQQLIEVEEAEECDDLDRPRSHYTYLGFVQSIYEQAKRFDPFISDQQIHFSAQNDDWELHWQQRTGIPLVTLKQRWESLRILQPSTQEHSIGTSSIPSRKVGALRLKTQRVITEYSKSEPCSSRWTSNVATHGRIFQFERGTLRDEELPLLLDVLTYRLNMTYETDEFVLAMGLTFPSCFGFQVDGYRVDNEAKARVKQQAFVQLCRTGLFNTPARHHSFPKPVWFLSIVIAETCKFEDIDEKVKMLSQCM